MRVVLARAWRKPEYTIGHWIVDGIPMCHVLEDTDRGLKQSMSKAEMLKIKVDKMTAIPTGHYKIKMTYSPRFKRMTPEVLNVKSHSGIRVHVGNWVEDTDGCLLLGIATAPETKGYIKDSKKNVQTFEDMLTKAGGECDFDVI